MPSLLRSAIAIAALVGPALANPPTEGQVQDHCRKVLAYLDAWRAHGNPLGDVILVLGARTQEAARFHSPSVSPAEDARWIFLSVEPHAPSEEAHIQLDFNNLDHLGILANTLAGRMDAVILDRSTVKFTRWTTGHYLYIKKLMSPRGTLYLPLESWGGFAFGCDPIKGQTKEDFTPASGDPGPDAARFAAIIQRAMDRVESNESKAGSLTPWLPGMLQVPMNWVTLDKQTQANAISAWKTTYLVPNLQTRLLTQARFGSVARVRFTPRFLREDKDSADGIEYLACKP